ncbi:dephospho-CoA kinase [Microbacterium sp. Mu-80]|uniref:Dephospho-CoA kinase n=1 Tax=Microbacterium bandirmense TaxID=3122050 RepID=A0ABU8LF89_9MICO
MKLIAVTGGIGAGKSTVSRGLRDRGARIIDADQTAREVVDPASPLGRRVLTEIAGLLGPTALRTDGTLDRARVAALVFGDDALRRRYNTIIHPAIMTATAEAIDALRGDDAVVVHEIPLLTADSPPLPWTYDLIVTVEADPEERRRRLQEHRGHSAEEAAARVSAQGDEERRVAIADVVIRTDGSLVETDRQVEDLWRRVSG